MSKEFLEGLEIVEINMQVDNRHFIDPYKIIKSDSEIAEISRKSIVSFFDCLFECVKKGDTGMLYELGKDLHEINSTCLGYGEGENPKGKGFSYSDLFRIYTNARKLKGIQLEDFFDILVFTSKLGSDKVSDLVTNLIQFYLIDFTIKYCLKNGIKFELKEKKVKKWDISNKKWVKYKKHIPFIQDKPILFVPKEIVSNLQTISYVTVYNDLVKPYYKANCSKFGLAKMLKDGRVTADCGKIREKYPLSRRVVDDFAREHRDEYDKYKEDKMNGKKL